MSRLLCDRPQFHDLDLDASRFVVGKECGLEVDGVTKLEIGDEIPQGQLDEDTLRQIYEPPLSLIETLKFALGDPILCEACARRGVAEAAAPPDEAHVVVKKLSLQEINAMNRDELVALCNQNGISSNGSKHNVRTRLAAFLE